jgi:hypothetical protein
MQYPNVTIGQRGIQAVWYAVECVSRFGRKSDLLTTQQLLENWMQEIREA